jgi:hypothetical protein
LPRSIDAGSPEALARRALAVYGDRRPLQPLIGRVALGPPGKSLVDRSLLMCWAKVVFGGKAMRVWRVPPAQRSGLVGSAVLDV